MERTQLEERRSAPLLDTRNKCHLCTNRHGIPPFQTNPHFTRIQSPGAGQSIWGLPLDEAASFGGRDTHSLSMEWP